MKSQRFERRERSRRNEITGEMYLRGERVFGISSGANDIFIRSIGIGGGFYTPHWSSTRALKIADVQSERVIISHWLQHMDG